MCACVCAYVCMCACVCVDVCMHVCVHVCVCVTQLEFPVMSVFSEKESSHIIQYSDIIVLVTAVMHAH